MFSNKMIYSRFAKTPFSQNGNEGKARFQASPDNLGKAVESLKEKTPDFQSGEAYRRLIQLIVGMVLGLVIGLFTAIVFGSDIKYDNLQTALFIMPLVFPFIIIFLRDLELKYFTRASFPKILLITFLASILASYVLPLILHLVLADIFLPSYVVELGGLVYLLAPVVYFPLFLITWFYLRWK